MNNFVMTRSKRIAPHTMLGLAETRFFRVKFLISSDSRHLSLLCGNHPRHAKEIDHFSRNVVPMVEVRKGYLLSLP